MEMYDKLFSLNYIEFWDVEQKCIHLHGKVKIENKEHSQNIILVSRERMCLLK